VKSDFLWAKKNEFNGRFSWLSLTQHLIDTSQVASRLWELWLGAGQKNLILKALGYADEEDGKRFFQLLAALHDLGKALPNFQTKPGYINSPDLDITLLERLERKGYTGVSSLHLMSQNKTPHALATQVLLRNYGVRDDIASILGGHHGMPVNNVNYYDEQLAYTSNYYQVEDSSDAVHILWNQTQKELFDWAMQKNGYESIESLPSVNQCGQVLLSGLVIMADWIASNDYYFPLVDLDTFVVADQEKRFQLGWSKWFKTFPLEFKSVGAVDKLYEDRFEFLANDIQMLFSKLIERCEDPGLFILEAPMGIGKTEAALIGAEQLAYRTEKNGVFFGLPTQATSNGIFPRINHWLEKVDKSYFENSSLQLVHGKAFLNDDYTSLAKNIDIDQGLEGTVIANQWFAGRKTSMLDDFVVGTVDQILLAALKQKHLALRHLGLSNKVVIIDEVHAYDTYMNQYLERAIEWLAAYEVPIILLSATLPANRRESLAKAYLKGKGVKNRDVVFPDEINALAYPLITYTCENKIHFCTNNIALKTKTVQIKALAEDNLISLLNGFIDEKGVVGIVVNTVKKAQKLAVECCDRYGDENVVLLHSAFIATERAKKEKELLSYVGKDKDRPDHLIVIGTQVIEQSLDIDFDVMISDLAPMDLLIQRMGRLHRHDIERPMKHQHPVFYVMGMSDDLDFDSGSVAVYGGYLLARTQTFLSDHLVIPDDISLMIRSVYGEDNTLFFRPETQKKYELMRQDYMKLLEHKKMRAKTYLLGKPVLNTKSGRSVSLVQWLESNFPNQSEESGYAQVRDSAETIEVIALKKQESGYSLLFDNMDVSDCLDDTRIAKAVAANTIKLPSLFCQPYRIDKTIKYLELFTRTHFSRWQGNIWLKGSLGILFDENNEFELEGKVLTYNNKYGLQLKSEVGG
jgi:CRISPR-associated endonuclease/helicase Cas3